MISNALLQEQLSCQSIMQYYSVNTLFCTEGEIDNLHSII